MDKYFINYTELETDINRPKYYKYADVKDRLVRVAYDVVKFQDANEDIDGLWQIQATDDGEVIVAMYEPSQNSQDVSLKAESSWAVIPNIKQSSMNVFYKGEPVYKIASSKIGVSEQDLSGICTDVAIKLSKDAKFRRLLLEEIPDSDRATLFSKYPELTK